MGFRFSALGRVGFFYGFLDVGSFVFRAGQHCQAWGSRAGSGALVVRGQLWGVVHQ